MVATQMTLSKIRKEEKFSFSIPSISPSFQSPKSPKMPGAFRKSQTPPDFSELVS